MEQYMLMARGSLRKERQTGKMVDDSLIKGETATLQQFALQALATKQESSSPKTHQIAAALEFQLLRELLPQAV